MQKYLSNPEIMAALITSAVAIFLAFLGFASGILNQEWLTSKARKNLLRHIRGSLTSFRVALFPAADRGMADPDKWEPIVKRISDLCVPGNTKLLRDREAISLEGFIREATLSVTNLRSIATRAEKRLREEPAPEQNDMTRLAAAVEGTAYDPRTFDFRRDVRHISRPLYNHLTATRAAFNDFTELMPDEVYEIYPVANWRTRKTLSRLYKAQLSGPNNSPWWRTPKLF